MNEQSDIDQLRYRRILRFFAGVIAHLVWWDLMMGRLPVARQRALASRPQRLRLITREFRGLAIEMVWQAWTVPPIFDLIQRLGQIEFAEMTRVFNMGLGWVFVTTEADADTVRALAPEALAVGRVTVHDGAGPRVLLLDVP